MNNHHLTKKAGSTTGSAVKSKSTASRLGTSAQALVSSPSQRGMLMSSNSLSDYIEPMDAQEMAYQALKKRFAKAGKGEAGNGSSSSDDDSSESESEEVGGYQDEDIAMEH